MSRYLIEIVQPQNESHIFAPTRLRVRGRWDFGNTAARNLGSESLREMARDVRVIPGQHIALDTDQMSGAIFDPLNQTDEGKRTWARIAGIVKRYRAEFGSDLAPGDPKEYSRLSADDVKTWLWEMRTLLNSNQAQQVSGSDVIPSLEEIARMPGKRVRDPFNTGVQERDLKKFVDVVPVKEKDKKEPQLTN